MTSLRSSASSCLTLLLASTTSAGSINTVFPVADSSCTIPLIRRFTDGATGNTSRPSRMVGAASFSTSPSFWAACNIVYKVREIEPCVFSNSCRMPASVIEAESLIFPNLSRMESILLIIAGNTITPSVSLCRAG